MSEREEMLERIRTALGRSKGSVPSAPSYTSEEWPPAGQRIMPRIAPEDLVATFEAELRKVGGLPYKASAPPEIDEVIRAMVASCGATAAVLSRNPLLSRLKLADRLRACGMSAAVWTAPEPPLAEHTRLESSPQQSAVDSASAEEAFREQCFRAAVGITGVDFVLAESGSMVLSSLTEGSQLASLAPPVHLAFYTRAQVVESLEEVLERLSPRLNSGRSVVFVTGTSRTADIEQILIRGVHGPREVHAVLVEESCLT